MRTNRKHASLFGTVPKHDYLGVLEENKPQNVVNFLKLTTMEVAIATGVSKASVRFDEKMPKELAQRLQEIAVICGLVAEYFKGDTRKTALWFQIKNPLLGNISPLEMIRVGRYHKLIKYLQNALMGDTP